MTNQEIYNYVQHTIHNTNPAILKQILKEQDLESRSDWNQNDPSAADYVKNRPFYTEPPTQVEFLPETTVNLEGEWPELASEPLPKATEGEKYIVWWNGVPYECYCMLDGDIHFIGNPGLYYGTVSLDDGTPFCVEFTDGGYLGAFEPGIYTIRIAKVVESVHTIEPKYIKDMYHTREKEFVLCMDEEISFSSSVSQTYIECGMPYFVVGRTYKVILNNIHYVCVAFAGSNGYVWIGNPSFGGNGGEDNGMPFAMYITYYDEIGNNIIAFDRNKSGVEETYSFTITAMIEVIHALDPKYLPCDMRIELDGYLWSNITADHVRITSGNVHNVMDKIWRGELVNVRVRGVNHEDSYVAQAKEIEADVCYYGGYLIVNWLCADNGGGWYAKKIAFNEDGVVKGVVNNRLPTTT